MKKYILTLLVLLCAVPIMAQDYNAYLQSAQNKFDLGDYNTSVNFYRKNLKFNNRVG